MHDAIFKWHHYKSRLHKGLREIMFVVQYTYQFMGRTVDTTKKDFAFLLYMNGDMQKTICERIGTSSKTLQSWIEKNGWKEKRSAANISRTELVNKGLLTINTIMDKMLQDKNPENYSAYMDQLIKCANTVEKLDKKNNVVNEMEAFTNFNKELQNMFGEMPELTVDIVKLINRLQDKYITKRLAK